MNKLSKILATKEVSDRIKEAIVMLYPFAVEYWGQENEDLILQTIQDFEILSVSNLGQLLMGVSSDQAKGRISPSTLGLTIVLPKISGNKIISIQKQLIVQDEDDFVKLSSIIAHELYFHAIKSEIQPDINNNITWTGLSSNKYHIAQNGVVNAVYPNNGDGFEELSTYYGQQRLMKQAYNKDYVINSTMLEVYQAIGLILDTTYLGKLIKEAQLTKDIAKLEKRFSQMEKIRIERYQLEEALNWEMYNELINKFYKKTHEIYFEINRRRELTKIEIDEYKELFINTLELNQSILKTEQVLMQESDYKYKRSFDTKNKNC